MEHKSIKANKKLFSLRKNPVRYVWNYWIFPALPLMVKVNIVRVILFTRHWIDCTKDKVFGKVTIEVIQVVNPWDTIILSHGEYRFRDICYRLRRKNIPWPLTKPALGTQCSDEEALPVRYNRHRVIAEGINNMARLVSDRNKHMQLRNQIVNHKFEDK